MKSSKKKAISLFSGAGGMDIGVRKAGFDILAEIEFDEHCCATLKANAEQRQNGTMVFETDIRMKERMRPPRNATDFFAINPTRERVKFWADLGSRIRK